MGGYGTCLGARVTGGTTASLGALSAGRKRAKVVSQKLQKDGMQVNQSATYVILEFTFLHS